MSAVPLGAATPPGDAGLEAFIGKSIEDICNFAFGKKGDGHNHCAHFVGHALRLSTAAVMTCDQMFAKKPKGHALYGQRGAPLRVHEFYATVAGRAKLDTLAKPIAARDSGLIFVTKTSNFAKDLSSMGNIPAKHVGILKAGHVIHYGNTADAVRKDPLADFVKTMTSAYGGSVTFVTTDLPAA